MDEMVEGVRVLRRNDGTFDAEVVLNRLVVWNQLRFRSYADAKSAADRQLAELKGK